MKFNPIQLDSLPQMIYMNILKRIESGTIQSGDKLPSQRSMAKMFKVGIGSVREGVEILKTKGYVQVTRGKGTYVKAK